MAKRQREWAKRARLALIEALGAWCRECNSTGAEGEPPLTIHHINGSPWEHARVETSWRISIYRREAKEGLLTVLCMACNSRDGKHHKGKRKQKMRPRRVLVRARQPNKTVKTWQSA